MDKTIFERFRAKADKALLKYSVYVEPKIVGEGDKMALYRYINSRRGQTSVIPDLTHDNGSTASRGEDKANLLALKLLKAYNSQTDELPYFAECSSSPAPPLLLCRLL